MESIESKLTLLAWENGRLIARVTTSDEDLASEDYAKRTIKTHAMLRKPDIRIRTKTGSKAEIRSTLRDFVFGDAATSSQSSFSIVITPRSSASKNIDELKIEELYVKTLTGKFFRVKLLQTDKIKHLKERIQEREGIPPDQQRLIFDGRQLEEYRPVTDYRIVAGSTVHLVLRLRGGGGLELPVDLSSPSIRQGRGVRGSVVWECFGPGFNILGRCRSRNCKSQGRQVVIRLGFLKLIILTGSNDGYECPACKSGNLIDIETFLVAAARAKFRFTKTLSEETETFILEAPSNDYYDFAKLKENDLKDAQKIQYDYIEITTAEFGMSFNKCQLCKRSIKTSKEKVLPCGRAFHAACLKVDGRCPICDVPEVALDKLPDMVSSTLKKEIKLDVPNQIFGDCRTTQNIGYRRNNAKPINGFVKGLSSFQMENVTAKVIPLVELQQTFVTANLPSLVRNTVVDPRLIERLENLRIVSRNEGVKLNSIGNGIKKCRELYKLIAVRESGITKLMEALRVTEQPRAVMTLSMFDIMLTGLQKPQRV